MEIIQIILPILIIALIGFVAAKSKLLNISEIEGISKFVFNFVIPMLLFKSTYRAEFTDNFEWEFLGSYYLGILLLFIIGVLVSKYVFGHNSFEQSVFGLGASYSNTVIIGVPVCYSALGEQSLLPIFILISVHNAVLFTLAILVAERKSGPDSSKINYFSKVGKQLITNPITLSLLLGLIFNFLNISIYSPFEKVLDLAGDAAMPCALFVLGASLNQYKITGNIKEAFIIVMLKLILLPIIVWFFVFVVFSINYLWAATALIASAMPCGINSYLFARKYPVSGSTIATAIILSTLISIATISLLLFYLI